MNDNLHYSVDNETLIPHLPPNLSSLINHFNDMSSESNHDPENVVNCKYYEIEEMSKIATDFVSSSSLNLFHLNISSLSKHIDSLEHLLSAIDIKFDVIAISETRLTTNNVLAHNIDLDNYSLELCPTESSAYGTALYIKNHLAYIARPDLKIYKPYQLESNFVELSIPKKQNIIVGCIYRHPNMLLDEFNECYLNKLLDKLSKENKHVVLLGDFNVDLLKYENHGSTNEFLDSLSSQHFLPHILLPTRICGSSKTLIGNVISNVISPDTISGNIGASLSDHLPQFSIIPNLKKNHLLLKLMYLKEIGRNLTRLISYLTFLKSIGKVFLL